MNKLEQLRRMTDVVADTGDLDAIERYRPVDATTNPSLLLKAASLPRCKPLLEESLRWAATLELPDEEVRSACVDHFAAAVGSEILQYIPGRVSTEVDARLSFDTDATVNRARRLVAFYEDREIDPQRLLIKIASTWEGIRAAEKLEKDGINCNLTLLFSPVQALAAADAGAFLISPFVGRIYDWYKQSRGVADIAVEDDPGVDSVRRIYHHYKEHGYNTVVMGASFRHTGQIEALAGCDRLTISPALLEQLAADEGLLQRQLSPDGASGEQAGLAPYGDESGFRLQQNDDAMATEKLAEGIRLFVADQEKLEKLLFSAGEI